jgi:hypothetical protein
MVLVANAPPFVLCPKLGEDTAVAPGSVDRYDAEGVTVMGEIRRAIRRSKGVGRVAAPLAT